MKKIMSLVLLFAFMSAPMLAYGEETASADKNAQPILKEIGKKSRKKKVEMCSECGKPEPECECHGNGKKENQ